MSNYSAPVCNVTPPVAPSVTPSVPAAAIPVATDMSSLLSAVNQIRNWIQQQSGQISYSGFSTTKDPSKKKTPPNSGFTEVKAKRTYATVKVTNPQDPTQYVMVKQIVGLTFDNAVTKQTITWSQ